MSVLVSQRCTRCGSTFETPHLRGRPRSRCYECEPRKGAHHAPRPYEDATDDASPTLGEWQRATGYDPVTRTYSP